MNAKHYAAKLRTLADSMEVQHTDETAEFVLDNIGLHFMPEGELRLTYGASGASGRVDAVVDSQQ